MEFSKTIILDTAYGYEPMTRGLAEAIRRLRCEQKVIYEKVPNGLNGGFGHDFALGKDLCTKARVFLNNERDVWD